VGILAEIGAKNKGRIAAALVYSRSSRLVLGLFTSFWLLFSSLLELSSSFSLLIGFVVIFGLTTY